MHPKSVHLIGVPFNSAGVADGVARAPQAIRSAGVVEAIENAGIPVVDVGDVSVIYEGPQRDRTGLIAPAALRAMIRGTRAAVRDVLNAGGWPLVIGGDCPVLIGCMTAPSEQPGLLFLDGHEDAWPPLASTTGEAADMELGFLIGLTVNGLPDDLVREIRQLDPDRVVVVGARDGDELASAGVNSVGAYVHMVSSELAASRPSEIGHSSAERVGGRGAWWLHVDLDVLSTDSLSAVDYQQAGGMSWDALTALTQGAIQTRGLLGMDVTIYNPDLDPSGTGASQIVQFLVEAIGSRPV